MKLVDNIGAGAIRIAEEVGGIVVMTWQVLQIGRAHV